MSSIFWLLAMLLAVSINAAVAADWPAPWVELAADGGLSLRAVAAQGAACPSFTVGGARLAGTRRGAPDGNFPIEVCEARAPLAAAKLAAAGVPLPVLPAEVNRIVVIGDTGCRLEGRAIQDCGDPAAWPFATIAAHAAARKPDLVIHLGDYYYRERACPAGRAGCAGSPHGDNWPTWKAELFDPAAPLLAAAPWVLVRGNHELCRRGGHGWFRLLDPSPVRADCSDRTQPYWLSAGGLALLMFDSADADDFLAPPDKVAAYAEQLTPFLANTSPHSWLVTHRPVWAMAQAELTGLTGNQTVQAAIRDHVPANLDLVLSGHLHDFISYEFGPERPAQLIVGTGGDTLLDLTKAPIVGAEIDGMAVRRGFADERFSYFVIERRAEGWDGTLYGVDDAILARCRFADREIDCR
ncbi:MAG: metallophosphoesterase [Alphaproteobacteria bacterium]|nr:metallophosphoesterase [Alphaproteobacteria bacterium]